MSGWKAVLFVSSSVFLLAGIASGQDELLLGDFEGKCDPGWQKNGNESELTFSTDHATRGKECARLVMRGRYPGLNLVRSPVPDWSKFDKVKMDIFNTSEEVLKMQVNLRDQPAGWSYHNRANLQFSVRPGVNRFELNLTGLKATNGRVMNRSRMVQLLMMFSGGKPGAVVYVDNVRLAKEKALEAPGLKAFDFGRKDSPVFPGFTPVTERTRYDAATGFGWRSSAQLSSADHVTPGALERDWVRGGGTFSVKVPNGKYHVWMLMADSGDWGFFQNWSHKKIRAEGRTVLEKRMNHDDFLKSFFSSLDIEDLPGQDIYKRYIERRWKPVEFDIEVTDGRLDVDLQGDQWATLVNALVVYPISGKAAGELWMRDLARRRRKAFHATHVEFPPPEQPTKMQPTVADAKRGYAVFQRPWSEKIWSTSSPKGGDKRITELSVSLARGEYEPVTFSIFPIANLGNVKVQVQWDQGLAAKAPVVEVAYVQYKIKRHGFKVTRYQVRPLLIRRKNTVRIQSGVTRRFWLTVHAMVATPPGGHPGRAGTPAGTHHGTVTITPENGQPTRLPLTVTVHDFVLAEPGDRMFSLCGTKAESYYTWVGGSTDVMWKAFGASWKNQREHGFNTIVAGSNLENIRRMMTAAKPYGMAPQFKCWLMHGNRYREGVAADAERKMRPIIAAAKENGWPEPVFTFLDEPANGGEATLRPALKLAKALRTIKGVKLSGDLNGRTDTDFAPFLDYTGFNDGVDICPATFKKIRDAGSIPWLVNAGKERFWWGFWFYKVSRDHNVQYKEDYAYMTWHGDPFYDLDAWNSDYCAAYPGPDGDINTPWFEGCREGIDDFRYLWMLERMVKSSKNDARSRGASEFLSRIRGRVNADRSLNRPWSHAECQKARLETAKWIVKLKAAGVAVPK